MRSHAKASTAGSTQRQATGLGRIFRGAFVTRGASPRAKGSGASKAKRLGVALSLSLLVSLALGAGSAGASQAHNFKEVLGSAAFAAIAEGGGLAIDQSTGNVLVMDRNGPRIRRFNPDGTPANFSALGSNVIDGKEGPDATPQNGLSFSAPSESQIAVDNSGGVTDGNIYVTRGFPNAIDVFSSTGAYLGQLTAAGATNFSEACGVAVDSTGALYVGDYGSGIHKFSPSANPPANTDHVATFTTTTLPCTLVAGVGPTAGFLFPAEYSGPISKIDSSTGELKYSVALGSHTTVNVDPGTGHILTTGGPTLDEFDASGAVSATKLSATKLPEPPRGIGVNGSSGEIYLSRQIRVDVYEDPIVTIPDATTTPVTNNTGVRATLNGTVNPDGVELSECFFEYGKTLAYGQIAPCAETPAAIGTGTSHVSVHADITNLQPNNVTYHFRLIAKNPQGPAAAPNDQQFNTPNTVITTAATALTSSTATLNGTVNPDTAPISECLFEWGLTTSYGNTAPCVPNPAGIGSGTSPVPVSANLSGLNAGTVYHFRLKAANANGPILAEDKTLQTTGPMIVDSWAEDVLLTEAALKAEIDPEGQATTFHFEYGTTTAYGQQTPELNVGSDSSVHKVLASLEDLQPGTTYHYRPVATNAGGTNEGPDRTIRTFRTFTPETDCPNQAVRFGASAALPDCRAYEMVSPVDKNNGDIRALESTEGSYPARITKSTPSGEKLAYSSSTAFADALSSPYTSQYIAHRVAGEGWETHSINPPKGAPIAAPLEALNEEYRFFSDDLCHGWMINLNEPPLSAAAVAGHKNIYRRDDRLCGSEGFEALAPIVTPAADFASGFQGTSADGTHALFTSIAKLSPEGTEGTGFNTIYQLYESTEPAAPPRFVCVLPNGEPWTQSCQAGSGGSSSNLDKRKGNILGAISDDGERIFWTTSSIADGKLYVRIGGTETVAVSQAGEALAGTTSSFFWGAATDGSRALYATGGRLFAFDVDTEATEPIAEGVSGVMGMSEDARRVYFVSSKALAGAALEGQPNLYLHEADLGGGTTTFIATVSAQDTTEIGPIARQPLTRTSRVTPDGSHLAFASFVPLTGYDNQDLALGTPQRQAYVYDAGSEVLICASCNPSGARDRHNLFSTETGTEFLTVIPGFDNSLHASRAFSEDGSRLYFNSIASLTPRDSNGKIDVYQWEAEGAGGCDASDLGFAPSADGCIDLISTGRSLVDSKFVEASADGDDVFINTLSGLVPQDYGLKDIYDARVGGGFALPPEAPECVGDACQSIPPAPNDPTPASAGFRGAGDPQPRKAKRRCRARSRKQAKGSKAKQKKAKRCRRNNRRAGR